MLRGLITCVMLTSPAIANAVHPNADLDVTLIIAVIDTIADRRPADLRGLAWSDPVVALRFAAQMDGLAQAMPDVTSTSIGIGNSVDGQLHGGDWLHDTAPQEVAWYSQCYGVADPCFADDIATFGLRDYAGKDKPAFRWLLERVE